MKRIVGTAIAVRRVFTLCSVAAMLIMLIGAADAGVIMSYWATTGQTAEAEFEFSDSTHLRIRLAETTPAGVSTLTGAPAVLSSLGFLLPDSVVIVLPGTVRIAPPHSASVDFDTGSYGTNTDVSGEWGATIGGEQPINSGTYDFVSTNQAQVTQFAGANLDGPAGLDGPQGGLLDDSAENGGLGVVDNSVIIKLTLDQGLSEAQQSAFFGSLYDNSVVEYGSNDAYGHPIPEPGTLLLLGSGLVGLAGYGKLRFRRKKK